MIPKAWYYRNGLNFKNRSFILNGTLKVIEQVLSFMILLSTKLVVSNVVSKKAGNIYAVIPW